MPDVWLNESRRQAGVGLHVPLGEAPSCAISERGRLFLQPGESLPTDAAAPKQNRGIR